MRIVNVNLVNSLIRRRTLSLAYKNGKDILPAKLLNELQKYIQGELIYIPKSEERAGWGVNNGTRTVISERNHDIYMLYQNGFTARQLSEKYNLSEDSIKKIVYKKNKELNKHAI